MENIKNLLNQIKTDKQKLAAEKKIYKKQWLAKLASPWALGAAVLGGMLLSRFIHLPQKSSNHDEKIAPTPQPASSINFPGLITTLIAAVLPKLIWQVYQSNKKK